MLVHQVSIRQLDVDSDEIWLMMDTFSGAHGGCTQIISFDGQLANSAYLGCNPHFPVLRSTDWDGDGRLEIAINQTNHYVFCYSCQMSYFQYEVLQIQDEQLVTLSIERLPSSINGRLQERNNRAIELAQAKLWKQAQETIHQAVLLDKHNETVQQNAMLIDLHAAAFQKQAKNEKSYPLLGNIFFGDYEAALQVMRPYNVATLFDPETPLIKGTQAETYQIELAEAITETVTLALQAEPELAEAYFLRAWATHLITTTSLSILVDLQQAVKLSPDERLFIDSLLYFSDELKQ